MNAVGTAVCWEATLCRLGLKHAEEGVAALGCQAQAEKENQEAQVRQPRPVLFSSSWSLHPS